MRDINSSHVSSITFINSNGVIITTEIKETNKRMKENFLNDNEGNYVFYEKDLENIKNVVLTLKPFHQKFEDNILFRIKKKEDKYRCEWVLLLKTIKKDNIKKQRKGDMFVDIENKNDCEQNGEKEVIEEKTFDCNDIKDIMLKYIYCITYFDNYILNLKNSIGLFNSENDHFLNEFIKINDDFTKKNCNEVFEKINDNKDNEKEFFYDTLDADNKFMINMNSSCNMLNEQREVHSANLSSISDRGYNNNSNNSNSVSSNNNSHNGIVSNNSNIISSNSISSNDNSHNGIVNNSTVNNSTVNNNSNNNSSNSISSNNNNSNNNSSNSISNHSIVNNSIVNNIVSSNSTGNKNISNDSTGKNNHNKNNSSKYNNSKNNSSKNNNSKNNSCNSNNSKNNSSNSNNNSINDNIYKTNNCNKRNNIIIDNSSDYATNVHFARANCDNTNVDKKQKIHRKNIAMKYNLRKSASSNSNYNYNSNNCSFTSVKTDDDVNNLSDEKHIKGYNDDHMNFLKKLFCNNCNLEKRNVIDIDKKQNASSIKLMMKDNNYFSQKIKEEILTNYVDRNAATLGDENSMTNAVDYNKGSCANNDNSNNSSKANSNNNINNNINNHINNNINNSINNNINNNINN
ncbi:hypothetical protein PMALA_055220, partial [Plasmodium malariae]